MIFRTLVTLKGKNRAQDILQFFFYHNVVKWRKHFIKKM